MRYFHVAITTYNISDSLHVAQLACLPKTSSSILAKRLTICATTLYMQDTQRHASICLQAELPEALAYYMKQKKPIRGWLNRTHDSSGASLLARFCLATSLFFTLSVNASNPDADWVSLSSKLQQSSTVTDSMSRNWLAKLSEVQQEPVEVKLKTVNDFFNRSVQLASDLDSWGDYDFWATPFELLKNQQGDAEDFVFAKLLSLLMLGFHEDRLIVVYTVAEGTNPSITTPRPHSVLLCLCGENEEPLILDSLETRVLPAQRRTDLKPVAAFRLLDHRLSKDLLNDSDYAASQVESYLAKLAEQGFPTLEQK